MIWLLYINKYTLYCMHYFGVFFFFFLGQKSNHKYNITRLKKKKNHKIISKRSDDQLGIYIKFFFFCPSIQILS